MYELSCLEVRYWPFWSGFIMFNYNPQEVHPVVFAFTSYYYPSQHNNYQNLIHVRLSVDWCYSLLHVSAHRAITRQYILITVYQNIELRSTRIHTYYILQCYNHLQHTYTPDLNILNILLKLVSFLQTRRNYVVECGLVQ
jgi:hypothetical protein